MVEKDRDDAIELWVTAEDAARIAGCSSMTIRTHVRLGSLVGTKPTGVMVPLEALEERLAEGWNPGQRGRPTKKED